MKTYEVCPYCNNEYSYSVKKMIVRCKTCNKKIILCSLCENQECTECKYEKQINFKED